MSDSPDLEMAPVGAPWMPRPRAWLNAIDLDALAPRPVALISRWCQREPAAQVELAAATSALPPIGCSVPTMTGRLPPWRVLASSWAHAPDGRRRRRATSAPPSLTEPGRAPPTACIAA